MNDDRYYPEGNERPRRIKRLAMPPEVSMSDEIQAARREGKNAEECFAIALEKYPDLMRELHPNLFPEPATTVQDEPVS